MCIRDSAKADKVLEFDQDGYGAPDSAIAEANAELKEAQEDIAKVISRIDTLTKVTYTFTDTLERTGPISKTRTITAKSPDSEKPVFQSKAKYTGF